MIVVLFSLLWFGITYIYFLLFTDNLKFTYFPRILRRRWRDVIPRLVLLWLRVGLHDYWAFTFPWSFLIDSFFWLFSFDFIAVVWSFHLSGCQQCFLRISLKVGQILICFLVGKSISCSLQVIVARAAAFDDIELWRFVLKSGEIRRLAA